ncbi:MAG TPA: hypothetical protein GX392_01460 [Clostridiales bacterium]|nr:hypothetical protein [Clostridiales bacterium]
MEKFTEMSMLLDIYGSMLTPKQRDIMDLYYNYDLTLAEIGENKKISRQGVYDIIKRSEKILTKMEVNLKINAKLMYIETGLRAVDDKLVSLKSLIENGEGNDKLAIETVEDIRHDIQSIIRNLKGQEGE